MVIVIVKIKMYLNVLIEIATKNSLCGVGDGMYTGGTTLDSTIYQLL